MTEQVQESLGVGPFGTVQEIRAANRGAGKYFFSRNTMRGFNSKVHPGVYGGRYFVVSNQFVGSNGKAAAREYRVCVAKDSGEVSYYNMPDGRVKFTALREARVAAKEAALALRG